VAIVVQGGGTALGIVSSGGPAIDVIGGFGDASVNLPSGAISSFEITDGTIVTNDLADNSVNSNKIVNGTILNDDILGNEITSDRLQNEPGAAQGTYTVNFGVTNVVSSVKSISITVPSDGYVLVMATATGIILHNTGNANTLNFGVSETGTALDDDQQKVWTIPSGAPTGTQHVSLAAQKTFPVTLGNHTFHLAAIDAAGPSSKLISDVTLSAVFIPTSYGAVSQ